MALSRTDRLRRVVLLCANFGRTLAYFHALRDQEGEPLLRETAPHARFWRQVNSDSIDVCVLDWCKLFVERNGHHHWTKIVTDPRAFEAGLLRRLGLSPTAFNDYIEAMRTYRNKFVAHLDEEKVMHIPDMATAKNAAEFLLEHVIATEAAPGELGALVGTNIKLGYDDCIREANEVFRHEKRG